MSSNAQQKKKAPGNIPSRPTAPALPARQPSHSSETVNYGTNLVIYFLALENFLNRYPGLIFVEESIQILQTKLSKLPTKDAALAAGLKTFIAGMPLDTISLSSHPKKIKQIMLESMLNPTTLTHQTLQTDFQTTKAPRVVEFTRDLQYYAKLCELSIDALHAREALTQVINASAILPPDEHAQFCKSAESITFKYLTDKAFCLAAKTAAIKAIPAATPSPIESKSTPARVAKEQFDVPLEAILLFRNFELFSREIVAAAGETYESMQHRAQEQRTRLTHFKNECQRLSTERREELYSHISHHWKTFIQGDGSCRNRQSRFLDFLSNPA